VCESEFVDLTPTRPEKVGDLPGVAAAVVPGGSRKVPYTIHVSLPLRSEYNSISVRCKFPCADSLSCKYCIVL